jgi:hypothetical protein
MPIIGQPAHTHFTPVITPVVLDRISLSVTYVYNVSAAAYRVSLSQTYLYDLKIIVSRSQVYLYHLNPVAPVGPTRLYFHAVLNTLPNLPTTERSVLTANKTVDADNISRTMSTIIGTAQTSLVLTSNATTTLQRYYFGRFATTTLSNISSITAQTWTYNFASVTNSTGGRFPVTGTNAPVRVVAYVWRPSTASKVGDIVDGNSASTVDLTTAERAQITTFSGNQVLGVQDGDVICFEVWFEISQGLASALTDTFYYDGPTVTTVKNTSVSNHASFIQTPQGLSFGAALTRVSKPCIQKYDIIGRLSPGLTRVYKYNLNTLASLSRVYRYNITSAVSLSRVYLYSLTGRISFPSITKYDILVRKQSPKIFRYALQQTVLFSRNYKYNIVKQIQPTPLSTSYKYNIVNRLSLPQVYKYAIYRPVNVSRIYRYSLNGRAALSRLYRYNLTNRITHPVIFRYGLAVRLSLSRLYRYNLTNLRSASSHYRYSLLAKLSASRIFRYNIAIRVAPSLSRVYRYNLTALSQVIRSSTYKYNIVKRLTISRIYGYAIATKLSLSRLYRYNITTQVPTVSRVYRYAITNAVTRSRIYRYSITVRILSSRNYLYRLLAFRQKPQTYLYSLLKRISKINTFLYRLGGGVSLSQTYRYNSIGRVLKQSRYVYTITTFAPTIQWQITGKDTDFPDSLENLVRDFIKENWSITDPVLSATPVITSKLSRQHQSQIDNFAYDNFRSYYIRVKEVATSEVKNRQIRLNTYEFATPIEIEAYARRLKKGEAFLQLNAMINELLRIFGTYQADQIFGVQGITLDRISSMEKERPPAENLWARRLRIILHYYRVSVVG